MESSYCAANLLRSRHGQLYRICKLYLSAAFVGRVVFSGQRLTFVPQLPESPRWLVKHGRHAEALAVISALDDAPASDPEVQRTYHGIREAVLMEDVSGSNVTEKGARQGKASLKELFSHGRSQNFRRASLGVINQCFQQITGINLIT